MPPSKLRYGAQSSVVAAQDGSPSLHLETTTCVVTVAHSEIRCDAKQGAGHSIVATIDVGQQRSIAFSNTTLRYMRPSITKVVMSLLNESNPD